MTILTTATIASIAIVDSIMYLVYDHNNYHMGPVAILGKLYTNSLMVLFNNRLRQKDRVTTTYIWDGESSSDTAHGRSISLFGPKSNPSRTLEGGESVQAAQPGDGVRVTMNVFKDNEIQADDISMEELVRICDSL